MRVCTIARIASCLLVAGTALPALAQVGPRANQFPDIIVSTVGSRSGGGFDFYGATNGIGAYSIAADSCNIGRHAAIWIDSGTFSNQHPVIGGQVYRLFNGRFEQIGYSWLKHGFCAADSCSGTPAGCTGITPENDTCVTDLGAPVSGCDWLGHGRATDTYSAGLNGAQGSLGPRSEINPWTGVYPYPWIRQGTNPVGCLNKRLLIRRNDLDPAQYPGAVYFGEVVYVMTDEWPGERHNNYSYRRITRGNLVNNTSTSVACAGGEQSYALTFTTADATVPMLPALMAWKAADPAVKVATIDVPNDGRLMVASKATSRGDGTWNYEYAVMNLNSDRGVGSFMIPKSASPAASISMPANHFRGVEHHSGEPYAMTPWTGNVENTQAMWMTQPWSANPNANAIRWSNLFNFRIISNMAPKTGSVRLGLFKPGVSTGDPSTVEAIGVDIPGDPACAADFDANGSLNVDDIFAFINGWFVGAPGTDFDASGAISVDDIFVYLNAWFAGCP
jgi:hypothetical protein